MNRRGLKCNCKLDSKVQKSIKPLLQFKNINSASAEKPYSEITDQINNEISNFLEKAS